MERGGWILAIEFGGHSIKAASVNSKGNLINFSKFELNQTKPTNYNVFKDKLQKLIKKASSNKRISSVGIAVPNPVDKSFLKLKLRQKPAYKHINGKPIKDIISSAIDCRNFFIENDTEAAAYAEIWKDKKLSKGNYLFLTLGTGLGGCFISDGKIVKGKDFGATESGEIWDYNFKKQNLEDNVGTTKAMVRIYKDLGGKEKKVLAGDIKYLANLAKKKQKIAVDSFKEFGNLLGGGLAEIIQKFKPKTILLSGNLSNALNLFQKEAKRSLSKKLKHHKINFKKSNLIDKGGLIGLALFA